MGSAIPGHPNPDTLVLAVVIFAYLRDAQPLVSSCCTYYALRCGDAPFFLGKQEKWKQTRQKERKDTKSNNGSKVSTNTPIFNNSTI